MEFIVDENFIGNKTQAKALLQEIIAWRTSTGTTMAFLTEASVNLADDPGLCELMVRAGFKKVFVGFETPSTASLQERGKLQNCRRDLAESVTILQVPPLSVRKRLDQVLLGRGQHAVEAYGEEITEQVGVKVLGASAHVVQLEANDSFAEGSFDLSRGSHGDET